MSRKPSNCIGAKGNYNGRTTVPCMNVFYFVQIKSNKRHTALTRKSNACPRDWDTCKDMALV